MASEETKHPRRTLQSARHDLLKAQDRDEVVDSLLRFAGAHFEYAALFSVATGEMRGYDAIGPFSRGGHRAEVRRVTARPSWGSMFRSVIDSGGHILGPASTQEFDRLLLADLGRDEPRSVLLVPIRVRGKAVMLLYADNASEFLGTDSVVDVVTLCAALPSVLEFLIEKQKRADPMKAEREQALLTGLAEAFSEVPLEARALDSPLPDPAAVREPKADEHSEKRQDDDVDLPQATTSGDPAPRGPDSVEVIASRLSMGGEAELSLLVALAAHGAEGAAALAPHFPGPMRESVKSFAAMNKDPLVHGPVVAAMAFLGPVAIETLLSLTHSPKADARFYATFLLGNCPDPRSLNRLTELLSDSDPRVATAARSALLAHKALPGFGEALEELRGELGRRDDPVRLCDVLRVLAFLADGEAVPRLIELLDHKDKEVVAEVEEALVRITKQSHGVSQRRWRKWYEANRELPRLAWLVEGLSSRKLHIRQSALEELEEQVGESFDFVPDGSRGDRSRAVERWTSWLAEHGR